MHRRLHSALQGEGVRALRGLVMGCQGLIGLYGAAPYEDNQPVPQKEVLFEWAVTRFYTPALILAE